MGKLPDETEWTTEVKYMCDLNAPPYAPKGSPVAPPRFAALSIREMIAKVVESSPEVPANG